MDCKMTSFALLLCLVLLCLSCKKEDPCPSYTCLNGGICYENECVCPEGFTGFNCNETVYSPLQITQVTVTRFPALNSNGEDWDGFLARNPDIYISCFYNKDTIYVHPDNYNDAHYTQEYTFEIPNQSLVLQHPYDKYELVLYDSDFDADDIMGGVFLIPGDYLSTSIDSANVLLDFGGNVAFKVIIEAY